MQPPDQRQLKLAVGRRPDGAKVTWGEVRLMMGTRIVSLLRRKVMDATTQGGIAASSRHKYTQCTRRWKKVVPSLSAGTTHMAHVQRSTLIHGRRSKFDAGTRSEC